MICACVGMVRVHMYKYVNADAEVFTCDKCDLQTGRELGFVRHNVCTLCFLINGEVTNCCQKKMNLQKSQVYITNKKSAAFNVFL